MNNISKKSFILGILLTILTIALINPLSILMSSMVHMLLLGLLVVFVGLFAGLVAHEKVVDERDEFHRALAGRVGYIAGMVVILTGIVVQTFTDMHDTWLLLALLSMILGKIVARFFLTRYH